MKTINVKILVKKNKIVNKTIFEDDDDKIYSKQQNV